MASYRILQELYTRETNVNYSIKDLKQMEAKQKERGSYEDGKPKKCCAAVEGVSTMMSRKCCLHSRSRINIQGDSEE